jgi:hypothetical protein
MPVVTLTLANTGHNLLRDGISGADNPSPKYFAVGTGSSTPTASQAKLDTEVFRKAISSFTNGASVGEVLINCYLAATDAVGVSITEVAVFGGSSASSSANTGKMLGRALWSHTKTGLESVTLQLDAIT